MIRPVTGADDHQPGQRGTATITAPWPRAGPAPGTSARS